MVKLSHFHELGLDLDYKCSIKLCYACCEELQYYPGKARQGMSTEIMNHSSTHCSTSQASVTVSANKLEWEFRCNMGVCRSLNILQQQQQQRYISCLQVQSSGVGIWEESGNWHPWIIARTGWRWACASHNEFCYYKTHNTSSSIWKTQHQHPCFTDCSRPHNFTSTPVAAGGAASSPLSTTRGDAAVICSGKHSRCAAHWRREPTIPAVAASHLIQQ